ncbi:MAG: hypothetical protein F6K16_38625 [Symploca sp. SIO2B6]|nr:hypothetical protein [Symploca sp. SIO2B6]
MTDVTNQNGDTAATEGTEGTENEPVTAEALAEVIAEFEQYRERLVNETLAAAKKAKMSKKATMENLDPVLQEIDTTLQNLRAQHATLIAAE